MSDSSIIIGSLYRIADTLGVFVKPLVEALKEESMGTVSRVKGYGNTAMSNVRNKVRQHKEKHTKSHKDHTKSHGEKHHAVKHGGYRKKKLLSRKQKRGGKLNRQTKRKKRKTHNK